MTSSNILFLGAGRMGGAILRGWAKTVKLGAGVCVLDPTPGVAVGFAENLGVLGIQDIAELPADYRADALVLAVKPQMIEQALPPLVAFLNKTGVIISIAAGFSIERIQSLSRSGQPVVRTMPNLAAEVGLSATVAVASEQATDIHRNITKSIMGAVGSLRWVDDEELLHAVTAISGSSPAYVFALAEALAAAAEPLGLSKELGHDLAIDTVLGAAALMKENRDPADLRKQVCSPGGTTLAALEVLQGTPGLNELITNTANACVKRSRELAEIKGK
ncbi:MAG TPA: pyrroline-5-carboxylate reductase [Devosia sp.]|nr:pyrroline-5-carboxylate reductase [Devosia sp.]